MLSVILVSPSSARRALSAGFSLFEMMTVIMIISFLVTIAFSLYGAVSSEAIDSVDRVNAKVIIATQRQAVMAGASFSATTRDDVLRELINGVQPTGIFKNRVFRLSGIDSQAIGRAARFLMLQDGGVLEFDPAAGQPRL